jgi:Flp pilus assembly pilin Flp
VKRNQRNQMGQTLVEYALILAFVALAVVVILGLMGENINNFFTRFTGQLETVTQ